MCCAVLNLRHDGRRVGLEGVLSGAALGLVLLVLVQDSAAAQGSLRRRRAGAAFEGEPGGGGAPLGPGPWRLRRLEEGQQQRSRRPANPWVEPQGLAAVLPAASDNARRPAFRQAAAAVAQAPLQLPLLMQPPWAPPPASTGQPASTLQSGAPLPPALLVVLSSHDRLVASTVDGRAQAGYRGQQSAIAAMRLDLGASPLPRVVITSEHGLSASIRSTLGAAEVNLELAHHGLSASELLLGASDHRTTLRTLEAVDLAALQPGQLALQLDLAGLLDSRVIDAGGNDELLLLARSELILPDAGPTAAQAVELRNRALADSSLVLAGGHNKLDIRSELTLKGSLQPHWQLESVALDRSQLQLGSGNDLVQLVAVAPRGDGLALRDAWLDLGDGDDRLAVQGQIIGSTIALGGGGNSLLLEGPVRDSRLLLSPGSSNRLTLSDQADDLHLAVVAGASGRTPIPVQLELRAGGGDDRLWLPQLPPASTFTLWGGEGRDRLLLPPGAPAEGKLVLADLQGSLTPGGWQLSDELGFASDGTALIPSGAEGLGQPRLLPIAPLAQLLAGIAASPPGASPQLAIATAPDGSELLWLDGTAGMISRVASLPALTQAAG